LQTGEEAGCSSLCNKTAIRKRFYFYLYKQNTFLLWHRANKSVSFYYTTNVIPVQKAWLTAQWTFIVLYNKTGNWQGWMGDC
jgi:hypothetical protein